MLRMKKALIQ